MPFTHVTQEQLAQAVAKLPPGWAGTCPEAWVQLEVILLEMRLGSEGTHDPELGLTEAELMREIEFQVGDPLGGPGIFPSAFAPPAHQVVPFQSPGTPDKPADTLTN
jgi:hypothetical protein